MGNSTGTGTKLNAGDARCKIVVTDGLGSWLDTLREHRDVREICNSMDIIADMMVHVENCWDTSRVDMGKPFPCYFQLKPGCVYTDCGGKLLCYLFTLQ